LVIHPPFWQTWWFRVLLILPIIAGVLYWHRVRVKIISHKLVKKAMLDSYLALHNISTRELEIVHLVIAGRSNKEIEEKLFISSHTVKNHLYNIYKKLNIKSRFQLINMAQKIETKTNTVEINTSGNMNTVNTVT
jgi:DNA-binding CsgD family transcriptional regulator